MKVNQCYELLNTITQEILGESVVVAEDLSNIVDVGRAYENLDGALDNYVRKLHDHIGKVIFVNRLKSSRVPSVLMDGWEYGSILEKIRVDMPDAEENEAWNLTDRASYDVNVFYAPKVRAKFWNDRVTFEIPMSFTEKQVKSSFSSATQLNAFYSAIEAAIVNAMTKNLDELIMRTINNFIGETLYNEAPGGVYSNRSGNKAVNLLYLYNQKFSKSLTAAKMFEDSDFIRFSSYIMGLYKDRMGDWSTLFNIEGTQKFTPSDKIHFVLLSQFKRAAGVYLYNAQNQYNNDDIRLPESETVTFWQGTGNAYDETDKINITTSEGHSIEATGIIGVMFDRDALGVCNQDRRVKTDVNNKGEFWTERHKFDEGLFNDYAEQFVVFYGA